MKRKATDVTESPRKVAKTDDYCNVPVKRDSDGNEIWPAPESQMSAARAFIRDWYLDSSFLLGKRPLR